MITGTIPIRVIYTTNNSANPAMALLPWESPGDVQWFATATAAIENARLRFIGAVGANNYGVGDVNVDVETEYT